jgi:hypothetical protein
MFLPSASLRIAERCGLIVAAQLNLGKLYARNDGGPQDLKEAVGFRKTDGDVGNDVFWQVGSSSRAGGFHLPGCRLAPIQNQCGRDSLH